MSSIRRPKGASMIVLTLVIAVLIVFVVGLFAFELNRMEVARSQLRSATEAAALAAVTTLASQTQYNDPGDATNAHNLAANTAVTTFRLNEVLGTQMNGADPDEGSVPQAKRDLGSGNNPSAPASLGLQPKQAALFVQFINPNTGAVVNLNDVAGNQIRCYGTFRYIPAFSNFVGVGETYLQTMSSGGVPQLDVVLTFDISGSIDDQTPITFVKRFSKPANRTTPYFTGDDTPNNNTAQAQNRYYVCRARSGAPVGTKAQGKLFDILEPRPSGSGMQATSPQQLNTAGTSTMDPDFGVPLHKYPLNFSPDLRNNSGNSGTRPGNYNGGNPVTTGLGVGVSSSSGNVNDSDEAPQIPYTFTDVVVSLDGNATPTFPMTVNGRTYQNLDMLVEAARGNLDSDTAYTNSGAKAHLQTEQGLTITLGGWKSHYEQNAVEQLQPIKAARDGAREFFKLMNTNTRGHFGFVAFTSDAGTSATDTVGPMEIISSNYTPSGSQSFPNPMVKLDLSSNGFTNCLDAIDNPPLVATSGTNIADSMDRAITELISSRARPDARKAIVVFTDGMPNTPNTSAALANCRTQAGICKNKGIPVYSIGLAQTPSIIPYETDILDEDPNPGTGGIAGIAQGNPPGKFFLVTDQSQLKAVFGNIARSLCGLTK